MRYYKVNVYPLAAVDANSQQQQFTNRADATVCAQAIRDNFFYDELESSPLSGMDQFILCRDLKLPTRCTVYALASADESVLPTHIQDHVEEAVHEAVGLGTVHVDVVEYNTAQDFYAAYDKIPNEHILVHFDYHAVP